MTTSWIVFTFLCLYATPCQPEDEPNQIGIGGHQIYNSELECEQDRIEFMEFQKWRLANRYKDDLWIGECQKVEVDVH